MDNKSSTSDGAPMTLDPASGGSLQPMPPLEALSEVVVMPDPEALAREAAQRFSELVREAAGSRGRFSVALSGGSTPGRLFKLLAGEPYRTQIPWDQVHLFWGDERCLPPDDPGSNYHLAAETLISQVPIPPENVHRMRGELEPGAAARAYDRTLQDFFCGPQSRFDLVLLGLGEDGHTASLFPDSPLLAEAGRLVAPAEALYQDRPAQRITLTLPAINTARHVMFLVNGSTKAQVVQTVLKGPAGQLPAQRIQPTAGQLTWLLDAAAAGALGGRAVVEGGLARVLACYGLGGPRSIRRIERGFVDDNWCVETDQGRFFLKRRHPRRRQSEELVRAQHDLILHLRKAGFPAPTLVPALSGETFVVLAGDLYELQEYIAGQPYDHGRPAHLVAAALGLGHYHTCVQDFAPGALRARGELYGPESSRTILTRLAEAWQLARDPHLAPIGQQLADREAEMASRFASHGALTWLVIHGDYYAGNLLFDGDHLAGLVDYDKSSWQPRVAELSEALIYFATSRPGHLEHLVYPGFLAWDPFNQFLQAYARAITLSADELRALPDYVCSIWYSVSLRRLLERSPLRPLEAQEALEEVLALIDWGCAHAHQMVEVARAAMV